jgi:hypothetical protein
MVDDECYLVLFHTPLFTFVRPLVLLIFTNLTCFVCFVLIKFLHHELTEGAKMDMNDEKSPEVRLNASSAFERRCGRTQCLRMNAVQSARASRSRPWRFSAVDRVLYVRPWITGTFESTPCVRTQAFFQLPISRPLVIWFSAEFFLGRFFREHFASVALLWPFYL